MSRNKIAVSGQRTNGELVTHRLSLAQIAKAGLDPFAIQPVEVNLHPDHVKEPGEG